MMRTLLALGSALDGWPGAAFAQGMAFEAVPYCSARKQIAAVAMTKERFASIARNPRDGNFLDHEPGADRLEGLLALRSVDLYLRFTRPGTAQEAEQAQASMLHEIKACLGETSTEARIDPFPIMSSCTARRDPFPSP